MKLTLNSKTLLEKLLSLSTVINSSNTLPILDCFLFQIDGNNLKITASDLETTMSTSIEITSSVKVEIAVPSRMLVDMLKTFPEQPLEFTILENCVMEINSSSGIYAIAYALAKDYPTAVVVENAKTVKLNSKFLAKAISKTIFATSTDDLKAVLTGVLFQFDNTGLNIVATDAHKLVRYSRKDIILAEEIDFVIPKKPLNVLKGILSNVDIDVDISFNLTNAIFTFNDYVIICRLIDGKYPNYQNVIPKDNPNKALVNRSSLANSVKCVSIFSNKTTKQLVLGFSGNEMHLSAEDVDYSNKANERLTCSYQGEDTRIGFNAKYLSELLGNISSEDINFEFSLPNRAAIITAVDDESEEEDILMLIMPTLIK